MLTSPTVDFAKSKGLGVSQIGGTLHTMVSFDKIGKTAPAFARRRSARRSSTPSTARPWWMHCTRETSRPGTPCPRIPPASPRTLNTKFAYDPDKAKSLLAEAGYANGFEFTIVGSAETQTDLQAVQKDLAAVGIKMNIKMASSTDEAFAAVATTPLGYAALGWDNPVGLMYGVVLNGFTNVQKATDEQLSAATGEAGSREGRRRQEDRAHQAEHPPGGIRLDDPALRVAHQPGLQHQEGPAGGVRRHQRLPAALLLHAGQLIPPHRAGRPFPLRDGRPDRS